MIGRASLAAARRVGPRPYPGSRCRRSPMLRWCCPRPTTRAGAGADASTSAATSAPRAGCCPGVVSPMRTVPAHIGRPPYAETGERRCAGTSRASSRPRSSSACAVAGARRRRDPAPRRRDGAPRHHHRRDRRLRARAAHRARRLPVAAQLQRLPEERVHLGQRGDLPRHPRLAGRCRTATSSTSTSPRTSAACTATPTPRSSSATSTRSSRAARARHRGVHVARHRGRQAGPPAQRHRPGDRGPRQAAPLRRRSGRSSATASASSSTPTSRCCTTTTRGRR